MKAEDESNAQRRLGLFSVGTSQGSGCFLLTNQATTTLDLATAACNSKNCPSCFITPTSISQEMTVTISRAATARWPAGTGTTARQGVWSYTFINRDATYNLLVSDGYNTQKVLPRSHGVAYTDQASASNRLYWQSGYLSTLTVGSGLTVEAGNILFSGTGTFQTPSGAHTINGAVNIANNKALTVGSAGSGGAVSIYGDVTIGQSSSGQGATTTIYGPFRQYDATGLTTTFITGTGQISLRGDVQISPGKDLTVGYFSSTSTIKMYGNLAVGDSQASGSVSVIGDFSQTDYGQQLSSFSTGSGNVNLNGHTTIADSTSLTVGGSSGSPMYLYGNVYIGNSSTGNSPKLHLYGDFEQYDQDDGTKTNFTTGTGYGAINSDDILLKGRTHIDNHLSVGTEYFPMDAYFYGHVNVGSSSASAASNLQVNGNIIQNDHGGVGSSLTTGTGALTLAATALSISGDVTIAAGKTLTVGSAGSGGAVRLYGATTIGDSANGAGSSLTLHGAMSQQDTKDGGGSAVVSAFTTGTGTVSLKGNVAIGSGKTLTVGASGASSATTIYGDVTIGNTGSGGDKTLTLYGSYAQSKAYTTAQTWTANADITVSIDGNVNIGTASTARAVQIGATGVTGSTLAVHAATTIGATDASGNMKSLTVNGNFAQSQASGQASTFSTGTGAVALNGDTNIADSKNFHVGSAGAGGDTRLYGDVFVGASGSGQGKSITMYGQFTQNPISGGTSNFNILGGGTITLTGHVAISNNYNFDFGTSAGSTGTFDIFGATTVGTSSVPKALTLYGNFAQSDSGGAVTFGTGTGNVQLNGNTVVGSSKTFGFGSYTDLQCSGPQPGPPAQTMNTHGCTANSR